MVFEIEMNTQANLDFTPFDDDDFRTWKQNKAIVRRQLNQIAAEVKAKKAAVLNPPSDVSRRSANWWRKIIQRGYMRRGVLRHKNGKPLTKKAMASILECGIRNVNCILKELIEKGYVYKDKDGEYFRMELELEPPKQVSDLTEAEWENWMAEYEEERQEIMANLTPKQRKIADRLL